MSSWSNLDGFLGRLVKWQADDGPREGEVLGYREDFIRGLVLVVRVTLPAGLRGSLAEPSVQRAGIYVAEGTAPLGGGG